MTRKASSNSPSSANFKNPSRAWRELGVSSSVATPLAGALDKVGFGKNPLVQRALNLGFELHAGDKRSHEPYNNHLARVTLKLLQVFEVRDPHIIAAGALHDSIEDHARELAAMEVKNVPRSERERRSLAHTALEHYESREVADLVLAVSNPLPKPPESQRVVVYRRHIKQLVEQGSPKAVVIKLADFLDNTETPRAENPNKRRRLDEKQVGVFELFDAAIAHRNSLVPSHKKDSLREELATRHRNAMARLALR